MANGGLPLDWAAFAETVPWLHALGAPAREWLLGRASVVRLAGGETLFETGSASDCLYILRSGSLGAFLGGPGSPMLGQVMAGETVGETGLITGNPRGATVRALRDSELLRLPRGAFEELAHSEPEMLRQVARLALSRAGAHRNQRASIGPRTIAVLPQTEGVDARALAGELARALGTFGTAAVVDAAQGSGRDTGWFNALEAGNRYVIYAAGSFDDDWRHLCLRQADALIFVAVAAQNAAPWSELVRGVSAPLPRPEHLVLQHSGKPRLGAGRRWLSLRPAAKLHHLRDAADVPRLARLIVGRCMNLVLSGGGARGFAHVGAVKALREAGIVIDSVGGTSIGGIIGAGVAADWSIEEMTEAHRRSFVATNPLSDRTIPFVSLVSGRKVSRLLRAAFGEREIEDLPLPFFCVSANLTNGKVVVHRNGKLWHWLRASVAIPGVLPPVFHQGQVLVDGGVINNLPVDIMRAQQAGEVIACDIGGDHAVGVGPDIEEFDLPSLFQMFAQWFGGRRRPSILQIMLRAGMVNSGAAAIAARQSSTLLIQPPLGSIDLLEWQAFDRAIEIGYQHTLRLLGADPELLAEQSPLLDV
jgi:NTE family protein